ncbi:MAG: aminotransferase class I/II-fold pyridoxal phosphate-dependent enzyme [Chloroflexi bacterium]|nr:aminotransferase class I/II-fold pyridoxal phosphate-dependent enzyme [Chloroflexota bacterium]
MRIKPYLDKFERKSMQHQHQAEIISNFSGLNLYRNTPGFDAPPLVVKAAKEFDWVNEIWHPVGVSSSYKNLTSAICKFWAPLADIKSEQVKLGAGSMRIIQKINKLFLETGDTAFGYSPQFYGYPLDVLSNGAIYRVVKLELADNFKFDSKNFLDGMKTDYKIVYIDNPNNPTGQLISLEEIEVILKAAKNTGTVILVDEAYGDYVDEKYSTISLLNKYNNLIVTRTFTKGYQFAQLWAGYAILPPKLCQYYDKIDIPFPITRAAATLAREALLDGQYIQDLRENVKLVKTNMIKELKKRGFSVAETYNSCPIFLLGHKNTDFDLWEYFIQKQILTMPSNYFYECNQLGINSVRVTIPANIDDLLNKL